MLLCCLAGSAQDSTRLKQIVLGNGNALERCIASQTLARYYNYEWQPETGLKWAEAGIEAAKKTGSDSLLWTHYDLLADLYDNTFNFDLSISYMLESLALKERLGNKRQIANSLNDLGVVHGERSDFVQQTGYYISAVKIYEELKDTIEALRVSANLAGVYGAQGNYNQSINSFRILVPQLIKRNMFYPLTNSYSRMAIYFGEQGLVDSVFKYSKLEIDAARLTKDYQKISEAWQRHTLFCTTFERYATYKTALDSMFFYAGLVRDATTWANYYNSLALYSSNVKKDNYQALTYYLKALTVDEKISDRAATVAVLSKIATTYELLADYKNAYHYSQRAARLKDSVINDAGLARIAEMQTKYQTEKKEARITILHNENKLQQRNTYLLIAGLGILAIAGFSLYRNNRIKHKNNQQLTSLNNALDEANQSKTKLFSILSHDLRSPVSNLFSYLQLQKLAPNALSEEKKLLKQEELYTSTDHLLNTMEDLLIWSKSQLENFSPRMTTFSLKDMVEEVVSLYQQAIMERQILLSLPEQDEQVKTDEYMLKTIIRNLLNNAVKYTAPHGTIAIQITPAKLSIFNSSPPIHPKEAHALFRWSNIGSSGSGYGLKLSKELADKLHITMTCKPEADGNTFILVF